MSIEDLKTKEAELIKKIGILERELKKLKAERKNVQNLIAGIKRTLDME